MRLYKIAQSRYLALADAMIIKKFDESGLSNLVRDETYTTAAVSKTDFLFLYNFVATNKPKKVIEFGTGKSTWVIAYAMSSYYEPTGEYKLLSLEDQEFWFREQEKRFPYSRIPDAREFVEIRYSDVEYYEYRWTRGTSYRETPREHFDLCFVDGPNPLDTFNADLVKIVESCESTVDIIIDGRFSTQIAAFSLLGSKKMTRWHNGFCVFKGVTREDMAGSPKQNNYSINRKHHKVYWPWKRDY